MSRIWEALRQAARERMGEEVSSQAPIRLPGDRRKNPRLARKVSVLVYGSGTDREPFHEEAATLDVNEEGCMIALESVVIRGQRLLLTNTISLAEQEGHVVHISKGVRGRARIGVEFLRSAPHFWHSG